MRSNITENKISEFLKVDSFYYIDFRKDKFLRQYEQFLDDSILMENKQNETDIDFITEK